jgi:alkanesulfonate monooxygenase SsuD/methylene tetrahydromethanopterin reductase-like flavin-dependent oxidoreductase (luciferase family)
MLPLSIFDLSPVASGSSGAAARTNSLDLARLADRLDYARYWVAEHHNLRAGNRLCTAFFQVTPLRW